MSDSAPASIQRSILFVDDEPRILDGLKRMLRGRRAAWDMEFLNGGQAALDRLAQRSFDVIVTDMRMPGIDGAMLLSRVKDQHPGMVRIVLSGHTELQAALRTVSVAHQFLSKPCDSNTIERVVDRACALRDLLGSSDLRSIIGEVDTLPALPAIYERLTAELRSPEPSMDRVAAMVHQDVAITAKLLQLVNSSFFGLARRVTDVRQAVVYLGMNMLRNLVLSLEIFQRMPAVEGLPWFSLEQEHVHAVLTGSIASKIIGGDRQTSDDAYLAGLLHDVGFLLMAGQLPQCRERLAACQPDGRRVRHEVEEELLAVSHAEIGAYLLGIWGMPCAIAEAVANHHRPGRFASDAFDLCTAVHVADALAHEALDPEPEHWAPPALDAAHLERVGVAGRLDEWRALARQEAARLRGGSAWTA